LSGATPGHAENSRHRVADAFSPRIGIPGSQGWLFCVRARLEPLAPGPDSAQVRIALPLREPRVLVAGHNIRRAIVGTREAQNLLGDS
jgi:hypothetical protein